MNSEKNHVRWCAAGLALLLTCTAIPSAFAVDGTVDTKALVLRKSASKTSKALQTLSKGDKLDIKSSTGDWYKVTYGKYTGYVMKKYVKASGKVEETSGSTGTNEKDGSQSTSTSDSGMQGIKSIKDIGSAPGTVRPGDTGSDVKKLQQALKLLGYYNGKIDGIAGSGTTKAVKAFQKKYRLSQDGIAGKVTIKTLFGQSAADDKTDEIVTESLEWFGHENTIPKGAVVTIKDCKTGKTFKAKRWSGANHMDTEPYSPEDTATMKSIYGGEWSWNRRAILVQYNGHVYAASMNGMPHGTSTIDNDFDGHFCIHFTGSMTHESKKVDEDHQNAVKTALQYTW